MKLVSFDAFRTLDFPAHTVIKAEHYTQHLDAIAEADWVLYPPYWLVNVLVFGLGARIFPSLSSYLIGHNKVEMTRVFETVAPANTPYTLVRANTELNAEELWQEMPLPFVAKVVKSSMGEGVFLIENRSQWREYCAKVEVLYVQEYLPLDRDLRIIFAGDSLVRGYWREQSPYSFHNNVARGGLVVEGIVPVAAEELVLKLSHTLGINHAGFDVAMVGGHPYVLEFNRLFGNQGMSGKGNLLVVQIVSYLQDQLDRDKPTQPQAPLDDLPRGGGRKRKRVA